VAIFGGIERRVTAQDFQGGHINAIFGGVEIDLTDANMQAEEATLEINAIFGGVEIRVPETWQVAFRGTPIFGGIADKTLRRGSVQPTVLPTPFDPLTARSSSGASKSRVRRLMNSTPH
jgi:predicted membrane protein